MTKNQIKLLRILFNLSYDSGFHYFPISMLAQKSGIPEEKIYDNETNTGELWEYGPHCGYGALDYLDDALCITSDLRDQLYHYLRCAEEDNRD